MVDDPVLRETIDLRPAALEVQQLFEEFIALRARGENPSIDDFARRHPTHADELQRRLTATSVPGESATADVNATCAFDTTAAIAQPRVLARLGDFRILREIGRGGMGVVYEAEQESLGRRVALKVLLAAAVGDPRQQGRFEREARSAAKLHHTNIVPVFGVGQCDGTHYYVMQFIVGRGLDAVLADLRWLARHRQTLDFQTALGSSDDGSTPADSSAIELADALLTGRGALDQFIASQKQSIDKAVDPAGPGEPPLPPIAEGTRTESDRRYWCSVARLGAQVADALAYAHDQGILHRDIKPANLLLDAKGTVWVADFGLAKAVENDHLTQTGDIVGTLRYMAPELFRGTYDARSDVYALGLTLYELIGLRSPFDARDRNDLMHKVANPAIEPLHVLCPGVPVDLETIVLKALEPDPTHRYASATEMADDLQRFLRDEPIRARRATVPQRLARWYRHNPVVARLTAALVAVVIAGFAGVTWKWLEAERQKLEIAEARNEAVAQREQAMEAKEEANRQASIAETINKFLVDDLLASAAPEKARGRKITVEEVLQSVGPKIASATVGQPEVEASVRNTVGTTLYRLGLYADAEPPLRRALELREKELGADAADTLAAVNNLAQTLKAMGQLTEAEALYRRSLEARQRQLGGDDPETLGALNNLAQLLQAQGRLAEAEPLYERSLEAHRRKLGANDPDTLLAEGALAALWHQQGRTAEAEGVLRRVSQQLAKQLGGDHPHTLAARHNLAATLQASGKRDEAETLFAAVLADCRKVLGPDHPETITTLNQLAALLHDSGKLPQAEQLVRQQLETSEQVLGKDHPQTLVARHNLSRLLQSQGKASEAEPLARENLAASLRVLGPEHPDTLQAKSGLAMVYQSEGKFAEAEPLLRDVLDTQRRVLGDDHPHTLISINNLAVNMQALGKIAEAEPLVRENLASCRRILGPDHPDTLLASSAMAQLLMSAGKWSEAEPIARSSYDAHRRVLGADHPEALNAADDLVTLLLSLNKLAEAEPLVMDLAKARERVLGREHPDTLKSLGTWSLVLMLEGKPAEAEPVLRTMLEIREHRREPNAIETLATMRSLALVLSKQNERAESERVLRDLLERATHAHAPEALIAEVKQLLGETLLEDGKAAEAEPLLREAVAADRRVLAEGHVQTAGAESALGAALTKLNRYDEAETLLLGAFGVLNLEPRGQAAARAALSRIIGLYEAWNKPDEAAEWGAKLTRDAAAEHRAAVK